MFSSALVAKVVASSKAFTVQETASRTVDKSVILKKTTHPDGRIEEECKKLDITTEQHVRAVVVTPGDSPKNEGDSKVSPIPRSAPKIGMCDGTAKPQAKAVQRGLPPRTEPRKSFRDEIIADTVKKVSGRTPDQLRGSLGAMLLKPSPYDVRQEKLAIAALLIYGCATTHLDDKAPKDLSDLTSKVLKELEETQRKWSDDQAKYYFVMVGYLEAMKECSGEIPDLKALDGKVKQKAIPDFRGKIALTNSKYDALSVFYEKFLGIVKSPKDQVTNLKALADEILATHPKVPSQESFKTLVKGDESYHILYCAVTAKFISAATSPAPEAPSVDPLGDEFGFLSAAQVAPSRGRRTASADDS